MQITTESKDKGTLESEWRDYEKFTLAKTKFDEANIVCSDLIQEMKLSNFDFKSIFDAKQNGISKELFKSDL